MPTPLAPPRPCNHCGRTFKPIKGNHRGMCSTLCRFMSKVTFAENGCWTWTAYLNSDGYGIFRDRSHTTPFAHRWAFTELGQRVLVDGLTLDHLCRNRACVNPDHLEQVTHQENMRRSAGHDLLTHCAKAGHEFTPENTGWNDTGRTKRYCRQCARDRQAPWARQYRALKKEQTNA